MEILKPFGKNVQPESLKITLCDTNADVSKAWLEYFQSVNEVEIAQGSCLDTECDALVSPANSFGDMGGGVDKHIDDFFEGEAQNKVMATIREKFYGELPVGMALIIEMENQRFPFLIVSPTMRVPSNVRGTINAYLAMRAILVAVQRHNKISPKRIRHIAISGLCTGVGGMPFDESAQQMWMAYDNVIGGRWEKVISPILAPYAYKLKDK